MKRKKYILLALLALLMLNACGVKNQQLSLEPTVTTTGNPSDEGGTEMIGNVFFRRIEEKKGKVKNRQLQCVDGEVLYAYVETVILNGEEYPKEVLVKDRDENAVYHFYTEQNGDIIFLYEEYGGQKQLAGVRGSYYCPWIYDRVKNSMPSEDIVREVLEKVQLYGTDISEAWVCHYPSFEIVSLGDVYMTVYDGNSVPGTWINSEAMLAIEGLAFSFSRITMNKEIEYQVGDYYYRIREEENGRILYDFEGNELAVLYSGSARFDKDQWIVSDEYGESTIGGEEVSIVFEGLKDPRDSSVLSGTMIRYPFVDFSEILTTLYDKSVGLSVFDAEFLLKDGILSFSWRIDENQIVDVGNQFRIIGDNVTGEALGNPYYSDNRGMEIEISQYASPEGVVESRYRFENLSFLSDDRDSVLGMRIVSELGGIDATYAGIFKEFPTELTHELIEEDGKLISEIYRSGTQEIVRINYCYYTKDRYESLGISCVEYLYIKGIPYRKAIHFVSRTNETVEILYDEEGNFSFRLNGYAVHSDWDNR